MSLPRRKNHCGLLRYPKLRYPEAAAWQISLLGQRDFVTPEGIRVAPALTLIADLV